MRPESTAARLVGVASLLGAGVAGVIWLLGFLPRSPLALGWVRMLVVAAIPIVCALPLTVGRLARRSVPGSSRSIDFLRLSGWRRRVLGAVGIAVVAALISAIFQGAGSPEVIDGRYFRNDHGDLTEIDRDEWLHLHTLESRIVAGHVLVFGLAGGLHLTQPA